MSLPRDCNSCHGDTAFERRVRCNKCSGLVHPSCRDAERICWYCRWVEARRRGERPEAPRPARPNPFADH